MELTKAHSAVHRRGGDGHLRDNAAVSDGNSRALKKIPRQVAAVGGLVGEGGTHFVLYLQSAGITPWMI